MCEISDVIERERSRGPSANCAAIIGPCVFGAQGLRRTDIVKSSLFVVVSIRLSLVLVFDKCSTSSTFVKTTGIGVPCLQHDPRVTLHVAKASCFVTVFDGSVTLVIPLFF